MHAIKLLGQQLGKIWSQLGVNQKVTIVVSGLAVLIGLGGLVVWSSRPNYSLLYGRLDPTEAGKIVGELDELKIPNRVGVNGSSVYVPQGFVHRARMELATKGLPKESGVGFEIFDKPAFGMSDFVQQANYMRAVQGELERTIAQIDGVESARVMIVKPESRLLVDPNKKTTASVFLKLRSSGAVDGSAVNTIRFLVANSVEGLKASSVFVGDNAGNVLSEVGEEGSLHAMSTSQFAARTRAEEYFEDKLTKLLEGFLGPNQVRVSVAAKIENESLTVSAEDYPQEGAVARLKTIRDETTDSETPRPGGVVGTPINTSTDTNAPAFATINNRTTKKDTTEEFALSFSRTNLVRTAGNIKKITASVFINSTDNPNVAGMTNELTKAIINALGVDTLGQTIEEAPEVALAFVPFNIQHEVQLSMKLEEEEKTELIWKIGRSSLYALLGLAALIGFWRLIRNSSEELLPTGIPVGQLIGGQLVYEAPSAAPGMAMSTGVIQATQEQRVEEIMPEDEDVEELQAAKSKMVMDFGLGQQAPERITIEVLKQLIRENPVKMSQAARTWMSRKAQDGEQYS